VVDNTFLTGKVPPDVLSRIVFRRTGAPNRRLLLGPALGEDAAIIRTRGKFLILTTDPITGAQENAGWLSVHVNANDVATRGAKPVWFLCCLLLPEHSGEDVIDQIMSQVDEAAREISVTVAGGHSEITPGLLRPIIVGSMVGEITSGKYVSTAGAKPGDKIILTKTIGLEGTSILAYDLHEKLAHWLKDDIIEHAKAFTRRISVVRDAMIAVKMGGVHAMHDPTEGGLIEGLWDIGEAGGRVKCRRGSRNRVRLPCVGPRSAAGTELGIASDHSKASERQSDHQVAATERHPCIHDRRNYEARERQNLRQTRRNASEA
jgi:hydrogenase expression/formation protein HypE